MADDETPDGARTQPATPAPGPPAHTRGPAHSRPRNKRLIAGLSALLVLLAGGALVGALGGSGTPPTSHHAPPSTGAVPTEAASPSAAPSPAPSPSKPAQATPVPSPTAAPSPTTNPDEPSGQAMPAGDLPGWRMVFSDDFTGTSLNRRAWGAYEGQPGGDPGGWWDPSHVVVSGGALNLESYRDPSHAGPKNPNGYVSGGVSSAPALRQTFGKYLVRFRLDKGTGIAGIMLLWPSNGVWPPEIDFGEDGGGGRTQTTATLHYGKSDDQIARSISADFSQWHTLGVEWTAGKLVFTMDGAAWATIQNPEVPAENMEMDLQTQAGTCGDPIAPCPDASTPAKVSMQVDWVVAYAPAG